MTLANYSGECTEIVAENFGTSYEPELSLNAVSEEIFERLYEG